MRLIFMVSKILIILTFLTNVSYAGNMIKMECSKNRFEKRFILDSLEYEHKLRENGIKNMNTCYDVLSFKNIDSSDNVWSVGICTLRLKKC